MRNSQLEWGGHGALFSENNDTLPSYSCGERKKKQQKSKNELDVSAGMCCGFEKKTGSCSPVASGVCVRPLDPALPALAIIPPWMSSAASMYPKRKFSTRACGLRLVCVCDCSLKLVHTLSTAYDRVP